jgi:hypothetical protein
MCVYVYYIMYIYIYMYIYVYECIHTFMSIYQILGIDLHAQSLEKRRNSRNNGGLDLPTDIVESYKYVKYLDDQF